jgi:hypothetical protein
LETTVAGGMWLNVEILRFNLDIHTVMSMFH